MSFIYEKMHRFSLGAQYQERMNSKKKETHFRVWVEL